MGGGILRERKRCSDIIYMNVGLTFCGSFGLLVMVAVSKPFKEGEHMMGREGGREGGREIAPAVVFWFAIPLLALTH